MMTWAITIALAMMAGTLALNLWRLLLGPSSVDRVIALDTMYVNTIALLVLVGIRRDSDLFFEAGLIIAMLGFVGTVALCRYLLRGRIVE